MNQPTLFRFDPQPPDTVTSRVAAVPTSPTAPLRMAPANPETVLRDEAIAALEANRGRLLNYLRDKMRQVYLARKAKQGALAFVTADDARMILDTDPNIPGPEKLRRNFLGALFKAKGWEATGQMTLSRTPGSHANRLLCWRWTGDDTTSPFRPAA